MSESNQHGSVLDHEYDGIREYDNPTPGWWHAIFIASFFFAVAYFAVFHFSPQAGKLRPESRLAVATARAEQAAYGRFEPLTGDGVRLLELSRNEEAMKIGSKVFATNCTLCHGQQGEGFVGPNLTDEFAKNIKLPEDVYKTVNAGVVEKGMPAWGLTIGSKDAVLVSAYVISLRGKNLPGPKGAEGEALPAWAGPAGS